MGKEKGCVVRIPVPSKKTPPNKRALKVVGGFDRLPWWSVRGGPGVIYTTWSMIDV